MEWNEENMAKLDIALCRYTVKFATIVIGTALIGHLVVACDPQWAQSQSVDEYITTKQIQEQVNKDLENIKKN